jgi:hypothetical protein
MRSRGKNRNKSKIRARVEHVFAVVKRLWGFAKVRYHGVAKNATRAFTAPALPIFCRADIVGTGVSVVGEQQVERLGKGPRGQRKTR